MTTEYERAVEELARSQEQYMVKFDVMTDTAIQKAQIDMRFETEVSEAERAKSDVDAKTAAVSEAIFEDFRADISPDGFVGAIGRICDLRGMETSKEKDQILEGAQKAAEVLMPDEEKRVAVVHLGQRAFAHMTVPDQFGYNLGITNTYIRTLLVPSLTIDGNVEDAQTTANTSSKSNKPLGPVTKHFDIDAFKNVAVDADGVARLSDERILDRFASWENPLRSFSAGLIIGSTAVQALIDHNHALDDYTDNAYFLNWQLAMLSKYTGQIDPQHKEIVAHRYVGELLQEFVSSYFSDRFFDKDYDYSVIIQELSAHGYNIGSEKLILRFMDVLTNPERIHPESVRLDRSKGIKIDRARLGAALKYLGFTDKSQHKVLMRTIQDRITVTTGHYEMVARIR